MPNENPEEKQLYPSWLNTKPVRLKLTLVEFLKSNRDGRESLSDVIERLLKWKIGRSKKEQKNG